MSIYILKQIVFFVFLLSVIQCQRRRGYSHRLHYQPPSMPAMFAPFSPVWPQFPNFREHRNFKESPQSDDLDSESDCPFVSIKKIATDGLYGMLSLRNQVGAMNAIIELEFDEIIVAFVVSSSVNKNLLNFAFMLLNIS